MDIRFAIQSYKSDSTPISAQRCVNAYPEVQPKDAKTKVSVHGFPGIAPFATCGRGPIRGFLYMAGVAYVVSRDEFYSIDANGNALLLGSGITGINIVSIAGNGIEVVIVNGTANGWIYTVSSGVFAQIGDSDFNPCRTVDSLDGYFVYDWMGTNKFFLSNLLGGGSYNSLDFASAESSPDHILGVLNNQGVLQLFGETTIEPWDHTGALSFPFQRYDGSLPQRGIAAPMAKVIEDNSAFFLGNDRVFYRLNGILPRRVSTHAIEKEWETYDLIDDAFCFSVQWGGHKFVYVTFPTAGKTWGYDVATQLWHERISWDATGIEAKWRINCAIAVYDKILVGDANSGAIGYLDANTHTEFGDPIRTILTAPPIYGGGRMGFMPKFEADMETGVGTETGDGANPHVMLDWSDDGGKTFVSPQLWQSMGAIGDYQRRLQWDRLGSFYQRTLRLQITAPVKRVLHGARCPGLHFED